MNLLKLFERLSFSELSNLAIGNNGNGVINPADQLKVLSLVNDGLLELYSRFILKYKILLLEEYDHITNYHLTPKFAESQDCSDYPYIKDNTGDPFTGDLIRILEVHDGNGGEYALNDKGNPRSLFTPYPQTLQVPSPKEGHHLYVTYQARHDELKEVTKDTCFELPFVLEAALQAYVASKIYGNMNGQENVLQSQTHFSTYERRCLEVEEKDLVNLTISTKTFKLDARGFV